MKRILLIILAISFCLFLLQSGNNYTDYSIKYSDIFLGNDTIEVKQITLPLDTAIHKSVTKKEKGKKHELKGRLKLSKRGSVKSREFGGAFIDESIMFRTR
ncbi:MAG: hypothetical protein JXR31_11935 [Prolixibacteraceae bacterium]|nr:hypothetical protein [Prolixibacteraceae bacterium]MBN2774955.1 hypothetical protein [Prolixibacteraceae bacterium]